MATNTSETATRGSALRARKPGKKKDLNVELRRAYTQAEADYETAVEANDRKKMVEAHKDLDTIGCQFYLTNRGLAAAVAKQFMLASNTDNHDDYVASGIEGLWEAFLKWDLDRDVTFGTFSRSYIAGKVGREVKTLEDNQISYSDFSARRDVRVSAAILEKELGRNPSNAEVAAHCGHTESLVERVRRPRAASLDAPVGEGDQTLGDVAAPAVSAVEVIGGYDEYDAMSHRLGHVTSVLTPRQLFVLIRRTRGLDPAPEQTLVEVADLMDLGREVLRRSEVEARKRLDELELVLPTWEA